MRSERVVLKAALLASLCVAFMGPIAACKSSPSVQHYQVNLAEQRAKLEGVGANAGGGGSALVLGVETLLAESAYDDERIVYRKSPYTLDYYYYHRWTSPPGVMVSDVLRAGFTQTGAFKTVTGGYGRGVDAVLSGRVLAIEEVDESEERWSAKLTLDLQLEEAKSGEVLWNQVWSKQIEVEQRNPEGVTVAISRMLGDAVVELTPQLVRAYEASRLAVTP